MFLYCVQILLWADSLGTAPVLLEAVLQREDYSQLTSQFNVTVANGGKDGAAAAPMKVYRLSDYEEAMTPLPLSSALRRYDKYPNILS